ncbi:MAG: hypothetical protein PVI86_17855, partial [Phycisphaerae bacterium]
MFASTCVMAQRRGGGRFHFCALLSLLIGSSIASGDQRHVGDELQRDKDRVRFIGVNRVDSLRPHPFEGRVNLDAQPTGIPVPVFAVVSDEEVARGGASVVGEEGKYTAIVYRNSHDSGYANFGKATTGNFMGNLLHLGNEFPVDGGDISGYDLLVYNSAFNPGGDAAVHVSLWDGDPLGVIDSRISDPPQEIAGSGCTFTGLVRAGTGSNGCVDSVCDGGFLDGQSCSDDTDCGMCPAVEGDDIPGCPGLFRLECNFAEPVTIASRNVWMIMEQLEGCRTGWRWAFFEGPEVGAAGEENFCYGTCPAAPGPCVDLAIQFADAASQWNELGVGTCCEDPGIACNHADGSPDNDCGHPTSCSDGAAETFDSWCYGAPTYFASFVATVYSPTNSAFSLKPVGGIGTETWVQPGAPVELEVMLEGWDLDLDGWPRLTQWQAAIDPIAFSEDSSTPVGPFIPACNGDSDCPFNDKGSTCVQGDEGNPQEESCSGGVCSCTAGFFDCPRPDSACMGFMGAGDQLLPIQFPGGAILTDPPIVDPRYPVYGATVVIDVPP